tara:strand:- start:938 stop:2449 length:1512 start_codon:yes stop_codon:yes gene_type:complete
MTYIMSEYEYGVACIAHGEEDATVMFLLKAGFVGFDGDDVLLKQQAGSFTNVPAEGGGIQTTRMGRHGEQRPGEMPGVYTAPGGASMQPTRTQQQFSIPVLRPSERAQVRSFAQQQGMEPTRAAPGEKGPSAYYDFGEGAPKIPASMMERAKARLGRMGEQGKQFLNERRGSRATEAFTGAMAGQDEEAQRKYLADIARNLGVDVSEFGKPEKDDAPAAPAQEAAPPAAPAPEVPTDVAPTPAPDPAPAPDPTPPPTPASAPDPTPAAKPEPAAKPKTAPTAADPEAGKEIRAKKDAKTVKVAPKSTEVAGQDPVDDELQQQQDELNEQLKEIQRRQEGGATTPSMPEPKAPPATMTAPEGEELSEYQQMMAGLGGLKGYGGSGKSLGSLVGRFRDASGNPITEEGDFSLPLQLGDKGLTDTMARRLQEGYENEANQEMMRRYFGPDFTGTFAPKQPVGGGPPADMEFVDPNADPMNPQKLNLSYDSPMDLAWDALLFRKTHQ